MFAVHHHSSLSRHPMCRSSRCMLECCTALGLLVSPHYHTQHLKRPHCLCCSHMRLIESWSLDCTACCNPPTRQSSTCIHEYCMPPPRPASVFHLPSSVHHPLQLHLTAAGTAQALSLSRHRTLHCTVATHLDRSCMPHMAAHCMAVAQMDEQQGRAKWQHLHHLEQGR